MTENDSWIYQGRQHHMWFGHDTKPKSGSDRDTTQDNLPVLQDRIESVGHTFPAALPASQRHHAVARLSFVDRSRLSRLLNGIIHALPLGPRQIPTRVLGVHPDAPGMGSFVKAGRLLHSARTYAEVRNATDHVERSAQDMGLDRFRPFLQRADNHLQQAGGLPALQRDVSFRTNGRALAEHRNAADSSILPAAGEGPTAPPPNEIPGGPWKWSADSNNSRGGKFVGSGGGTASWDDVDGHWDVDDGSGQRTRYNRFGAPLTPEEAHGPYRGPPRVPLPFRLFRVLPPFLLPEQMRQILGPDSA